MAQAKYITVAELVETLDTRIIGELTSDSGSATTVNESNAPALNAIERASGLVEAAAVRGSRYTTSDLTDLQGGDNWILKGLVAGLAKCILYQRRPPVPDAVEVEWKGLQDQLKALANGEIIFADDDAADAGKAEVQVISATNRGELGLVSDEPYFPVRRTRTV